MEYRVDVLDYSIQIDMVGDCPNAINDRERFKEALKKFRETRGYKLASVSYYKITYIEVHIVFLFTMIYCLCCLRTYNIVSNRLKKLFQYRCYCKICRVYVIRYRKVNGESKTLLKR